jgi:hypothetical protein
MSDREIRTAPDPGVFHSRRIPDTSSRLLFPGPWVRLYQKKYTHQFFPSPGSRLTPTSRDFACVYLATTHETIVSEIFGDRFAAAQKAGKRVYSIAKSVAREYAFLRVDALPHDLVICDLTDTATLAAVGIDATTLYSTDLRGTQLWAERIARHPQHFDGILYPSRHTFQPCIMLWNRPAAPRDLSKEITFLPEGDFMYSKPVYAAAAARQLRLSYF